MGAQDGDGEVFDGFGKGAEAQQAQPAHQEKASVVGALDHSSQWDAAQQATGLATSPSASTLKSRKPAAAAAAPKVQLADDDDDDWGRDW